MITNTIFCHKYTFKTGCTIIVTAQPVFNVLPPTNNYQFSFFLYTIAIVANDTRAITAITANGLASDVCTIGLVVVVTVVVEV